MVSSFLPFDKLEAEYLSELCQILCDAGFNGFVLPNGLKTTAGTELKKQDL